MFVSSTRSSQLSNLPLIADLEILVAICRSACNQVTGKLPDL